MNYGVPSVSFQRLREDVQPYMDLYIHVDIHSLYSAQVGWLILHT